MKNSRPDAKLPSRSLETSAPTPKTTKTQIQSYDLKSSDNMHDPSTTKKPMNSTEMHQRCKNYAGVSFRKVDNKFMVSILIGKTRFLGMYSLASDGAYVYDAIYIKFRGGIAPNFATMDQFTQARNQEMKETGLEVSTVGTVESLKSKAADVYAKIINDISS